MGWDTVRPPRGSVLLDGLDDAWFYFVHSYAVVGDVDGAAVGTTEHGERFAATIERGALSATQFHPEKSADAGAHLLRNWVGTL